MKKEYLCVKYKKEKLKDFKIIYILLLIAVTLHIIFFPVTKTHSEKYVNAFNALGNIFNGEKTIQTAAREAYIYAFTSEDDRVIYVSDINGQKTEN